MTILRATMRSIPMLCILFLAGCKPTPIPSRGEGSAEVQHSMYYWRTVYELDSTEQAFLQEHKVERLYMRYFDVVLNDEGEAVPNATLAFRSPKRDGVEVVPTVFIMNDCMLSPPSDLAGKLLERVVQMSETNDMGEVREIQVDCDWTLRTRERYFAFLQQLQALAHERDIQLSTTIRLHQLSQPVPPADKGVLMVYNTGDVKDLQCEHPILDLKDVEPYLRYLKRYQLPMSAAYPLFQWKVLFRNGRFVGILHADDELPVLSTDSIVVRQPDMEHIMEAKHRLGRLRPDLHKEVILYDLQQKNITKFNHHEYEEIFNH